MKREKDYQIITRQLFFSHLNPLHYITTPNGASESWPRARNLSMPPLRMFRGSNTHYNQNPALSPLELAAIPQNQELSNFSASNHQLRGPQALNFLDSDLSNRNLPYTCSQTSALHIYLRSRF